jgi:adenosylhomocysteine nucleosidase
MKIAFIVAMPEEFRAVTCHMDALTTLRIGQYKACTGTFTNHDIFVLESGMGFDNAARAAETLIGTVWPDILISAGFCGGIAPDLGVGAVVLATRLVLLSGDVVVDVPVEFAVASRNFVSRQSVSGYPAFGSLFISTPVITSKAHIASLLPIGSPHPVVEMESAAIAQISAEKGIPFVGIRSVSDPAGEELGFSLNEFCDDRMRIRIPLVLLTIFRKPRIIPQLVRLSRNSRIAGASLARAIEQFLAIV